MSTNWRAMPGTSRGAVVRAAAWLWEGVTTLWFHVVKPLAIGLLVVAAFLAALAIWRAVGGGQSCEKTSDGVDYSQCAPGP